MKYFVVNSVVSAILIGIISSSLGLIVTEWQYWAFVIPANILVQLH